MPCIPQEQVERAKVQPTLDRLVELLADGDVTVVISPQGAIAFKGWTESNGISDVCAYRALVASNSPELRRAVMRAQVTSPNRLSTNAISSGLHSHDGGQTWSRH